MRERMDEIATTVATHTTRRSTLRGLSALALGALGLLAGDRQTAAKNNACQQCKQQCKRNNKKAGKKDPKNCNNKCRNKCKNT
jgi:hypothetical protein